MMVRMSSPQTEGSDIRPFGRSFHILQALFWATFASGMFTVLLVKEKGLSPTVIGTIFAVRSLVSAVSPPFWGLAVDRLRSPKVVFIVGLASAAICYAAIPFIDSIAVLGILICLTSFFLTALPSILDTWVIDSVSGSTRVSFGSIRLWGSIGYSVVIYIYGVVIDHFSLTPVFLNYVVLGAVTIFFAWRTESPVLSTNDTERRLRPLSLFTNLRYVAVVLFTVILMIPSTSSFVFLPQIVDSVDGTSGLLGTLYAVKALSEIPFFLYSKRLLNRYSPLLLVIVSSLFFILQFFLYSVITNPVQILFVQFLHGPSFGLFITGMVYYIYSLAPENLKATAQTTAYALRIGLAGIIGSSFGGWYIDTHGIQALFRLGTYVSIAALALFIAFHAVLHRRARR